MWVNISNLRKKFAEIGAHVGILLGARRGLCPGGNAMIRKLRIRFIAVATLSAAIVIIAVSCGILLTNRRQTLQNIDGMLSLLAQNEGRFPNAPNGGAPSDSTQDADTAKPAPPAPRGGKSPIRSPETPFRTRFFMAAADADGNILRV